MPGIGPMELVVVLIIALIVLGPKRLPDAGRSLGAGMRGFKDSLSGHDEPAAPAITKLEEDERVDQAA
jgi:sec-independent protein translocase protein TatA